MTSFILGIIDKYEKFYYFPRETASHEQNVTPNVQLSPEQVAHDGSSLVETSAIGTASYLKRRRSDGYSNEKYENTCKTKLKLSFLSCSNTASTDF